MIFNRGRTKENESIGQTRTVESETLSRWRNAANHKSPSDLQEEERSAHDDQKVTVIDVPPPSSTINLTDSDTVENFAERTPPLKASTPEHRVIPCDMTIPIEEDLKRRFGTNVRSALGPGTVIEGTFRFDTPVCIDGTLTGQVCSSSALIVGDQAVVSAQVKVGSLIILGQVCGDVQANELIEIRAGGNLQGDIVTRRLVMEDGGCFNGCCNTLD